MNPAAKLLWYGFFGVVALCIVAWLMGCTTEKKVEAAKLSAEALSCRAKLSRVIQAAPSCGVAAAGVRQVIKEDATCIDVFMGGGVELHCPDAGGAQ